MKNIFFAILLFIVFALHKGYSQKVGKLYLPPQTSETPQFFKVFYQEDYLNKVNVFKLDKASKAYEEEVEERMQKEPALEKEVANENQTGEENEDIYLLYYKRWRRTMAKYVQENGSIKIVDQTELKDHHNDKNLKKTGANWTLLEPNQTFSKFQDNPAQPQVTWQSNINACAVAPSNTSVLYAGAATSGIYKTIDKGLHWSLVLDDANVYSAVAVNPTNPNIVYAGVDNAIKKVWMVELHGLVFL